MPLNEIFSCGLPGVPADLIEVIGERELVSLSLESIHEVSWPKLGSAASLLSATPLQVLRTVLVYAYARGVFSTFEMERLCHEDATFRYICAGAGPVVDELRAFRRSHLVPIQNSLAWVIYMILRRDLVPSFMPETYLHETAMAQAALRLRRAIQIDSTALDE